MFSLAVMKTLESFNMALQCSQATVSGMLMAADMVRKHLESLRTDEKIKEIFTDAENKIDQLDLKPLSCPRRHKVPKRYNDESAQFYAASVEEFYRIEFYKVIDSALLNMVKYFTSTDLSAYNDLNTVLLSGKLSPCTQDYPELSGLKEAELSFFRTQFNEASLDGYRRIFKDMVPEVRKMFPNVEKLLSLLLISPASSCESERSFSALSRIKTWLRSTSTQKRLNSLMVCHVHSDRLALINPQKIAEEFIQRSPENRLRVFGQF